VGQREGLICLQKRMQKVGGLYNKQKKLMQLIEKSLKQLPRAKVKIVQKFTE
jgi:hypothetical protein